MIDSLLAQVQALVQQAYAQGMQDGVSQAAAPLQAIEAELAADLAAVQGKTEALMAASGDVAASG